MPLFFLHVRDGASLIRDPDGSCIPAIVSAKTETIYSARALMSQSIIADGRFGIHRRFEIFDHEGSTVAVVPSCQAVT